MKQWFSKYGTVVRRIVCVVVFLVSVIYIAYYVNNSKGNKNLYATLNKTLGSEAINSYGIHKVDIALLKTKNADTVGWISIPNSKINYPVLKATDNEFYLNNNFYKKASNFGSIFLDCKMDVSKIGKPMTNTVVYGHNMYDGQMFSNLINYVLNDENPNYYAENSEFYTVFENKAYKWRIFSVYKTTKDFNYLLNGFTDSNDYEGFLLSIIKRSTYKNNIKVEKQDSIITLSTCYTSLYYDRIAVHAKLIGVEDIRG